MSDFDPIERRFRNLFQWIDTDARRICDPVALVDALGARIVAQGLDIYRMTTLIPLLHPIVSAESILWSEAEPTILRKLEQAADGNNESFANSPLYPIYYENRSVHFDIHEDPGDDTVTYGIMEDLRVDGATSYFATPMLFSDGSMKALTFATRSSARFSKEDRRVLSVIAQRVAPLFEIHTLRRTARTLLDTYVGSFAGERVLAGEIMRGHGEAIDAVIWFSDLQNFTTLSNTLEPDDLIGVLNECFGAISAAVEKSDGQVLKFIGDAVLAIFPLDGAENPQDVADRALCAASEVSEKITQLGCQKGDRNIRCGVALHTGRVYFGNVGGERRLDFTVIGPAVNLASRIESATRLVDETILMSEAFRKIIRVETHFVRDFEFKGFEGQHPVYALTSACAAD